MATPLAAVGAPLATDHDTHPFLSVNGRSLWFTSSRGGSGGDDLWHSEDVGGVFHPPVNEAVLNSASAESNPVLSADQLTIYFMSTRVAPGTAGGSEIWRATRATTGDGFGTPTPVGELNTPLDDAPAWLSPDNCRIYLSTDRGGTWDVYVSSRRP